VLVLTRKKGEAIVIGENIKIVIVSVSGDSVKVGIEAPSDVKILRAELLEAVKDINVAASKIVSSGQKLSTKKVQTSPVELSDLTIKTKRQGD